LFPLFRLLLFLLGRLILVVLHGRANPKQTSHYAFFFLGLKHGWRGLMVQQELFIYLTLGRLRIVPARL
jgi:hypothetical protein